MYIFEDGYNIQGMDDMQWTPVMPEWADIRTGQCAPKSLNHHNMQFDKNRDSSPCQWCLTCGQKSTILATGVH